MVTMTAPPVPPWLVSTAPPRRGLNPAVTGPVLRTVEEAAAWCGRPTGALYRWHREGRIRLQGRRGYKTVDLRELAGQEYNEGAPFPAPPPVRHAPPAARPARR